MNGGLKHEFDEGVLWDDNPFVIQTDCECERYESEPAPCRHCRDSGRTNGNRKVWICPCVVIAHNEGGFASTGLCLNCIVEGAKRVGIL